MVVAHELALSPTTGTATLHGGEVRMSWSARPDGGPSSATVRCQTVADAIAECRPPDLIQGEGEGAEADILVSDRDDLAEHRVPALLKLANDTDATAATERVPFFGGG